MKLVKLVVLLLGLMILSACAGNLTIDGRHYRVSSCEMNDKGEVDYVVNCVHKHETPKFAHFEQSLFSPDGANFKSEFEWLCGWK